MRVFRTSLKVHAVGLLYVLLLMPVIASAQDSVTLRWNQEQGREYGYSYTQGSDVIMKSVTRSEGKPDDVQDIAMSASYAGSIQIACKGSEAGLNMEAERVSVTPERLPEGTNIQESISASADMGADGGLTTDEKTPAFIYLKMALTLPRGEMKAGEPVAEDFVIEDEQMPLTGKTVYTLIEVSDTGGGHCAVYDMACDVANDRTGHSEESHWYLDMSGKFRCTFSLDDGCLKSVAGSMVTNSDIRMDMMGVKITMTSKNTDKLDLSLLDIK